LELERLGYRDGSYPFDWVLSRSMSNVIGLIENDFGDLFDVESMYQHKEPLSVYENKKCDIIFVHDFSEWKSFEDQFPKIKEKYQRRVARFYKSITDKTLFIRYIETAQEFEYIKNNASNILGTLRKYNSENDIIYVANRYACNGQDEFGRLFLVDEDNNDSVARKFTDKLPELVDELNDAYYSTEKRNDNLKFYNRKHKYDKLKKVKRKILTILKMNTCKVYRHDKQI
jgi:hypothetical protein